MKKTAIAIAACLLAGSAFAQSNVTISGTMDAYVGSVKNSGDSGSTSVMNSGGMTTSWLGFKGVEDLGNGMKVDFALTSFLQVDTGQSGRFGGDNLFSRDANVGLSGDFGKISAGRNLAPSFLPVVIFNPFGDSFAFSPLVLHWYVPSGPYAARTWGNVAAGDSGWSNELIYTTPNFNGLSANIHYQFGEKTGDTGTKNAGINFLYFNGPLALTAFYQNVQVGNPNPGPIVDATTTPINFASINAQKSWFLGGSYNFGPLTAYGTYSSSNDDSTTGNSMNDKIASLGLKAPVGAGNILAAYADTKRTGSLVGADQKRDTFSIGYDYDLSKRTDIYTIVMSDKITNADRANSFALGMRHKF
jgi:predicted porin